MGKDKITMSVIDALLRFSQCHGVLTHDDILAELRAQVAAKKFTQKALADRLGVAPARIKETLKGERRIQQDEMPVVAAWLGMSDAVAPPFNSDAVARLLAELLRRAPKGGWKESDAPRLARTIEYGLQLPPADPANFPSKDVIDVAARAAVDRLLAERPEA
jgi:transcriptional regulator with XRE-family HTH domain